MKHLDIKIYSAFISTIIISHMLAFNYVYPHFEDFYITVFGYSIYVFILFLVGAVTSLILDNIVKNNFNKFIGYIISGSLILTIFYLIDAQEFIFRDIYPKIALGAICAIVFFISQGTMKYIQSR